MSAHPYLRECLHAALTRAGGDIARARGLLIARARQDDMLLRALAEPYIQGLAARAMEEMLGPRARPEPGAGPPARDLEGARRSSTTTRAPRGGKAAADGAGLDPEILDELVGHLDKEVGTGFPGKPVAVSRLYRSAETDQKPRQPERRASLSQANAMRKIAAAYRRDEGGGAGDG